MLGLGPCPLPRPLMLQPELMRANLRGDSQPTYEGAAWLFPWEFKAQMRESGIKWTYQYITVSPHWKIK